MIHNFFFKYKFIWNVCEATKEHIRDKLNFHGFTNDEYN